MQFQMIFTATLGDDPKTLERSAKTAECEADELELAQGKLLRDLQGYVKARGRRVVVRDLEVSKRKVDGDYLLDSAMTRQIKDEFLKTARPGHEHFTPIPKDEPETDEEDDDAAAAGKPMAQG